MSEREKIGIDAEIERRKRAVEARKLGVDIRPGRMVTIRVDSRGTHAVAGHFVNVGEQTIEVHELDVPAFVADVERADASALDAVDREYKRRLAIVDEQRRKRERVSTDANWPAAFRHVLGRDPKPFVSVETLSDEPIVPAKRGARS